MFNFSSFPLPAGVVRTLLSILLLAFRLSAAAGNISDMRATAVDATGSVYLAGNFINVMVLGGTTLTSLGVTNVFVAKFKPASNPFAWAQRSGGTGTDAAYALAVSGTSVYVTGYFATPSADFGAIALSNPNPNSALGFLAALTEPTLTATTPGRALAPATFYPKLAHRTATLRLLAGTVPAFLTLTLTDAQGRAGRHYLAPAGPEAALDLRGLPAGLYLLRGNGLAQRLLVK